MLVLAAECGAEPEEELYRRSAEAGNGWGILQHSCFVYSSLADQATWLDRALAQGEPGAMLRLARRAQDGRDCVDEARAKRLLREAAELGDMGAQYALGTLCCVKDASTGEHISWLRRSAAQGHGRAWGLLVNCVSDELAAYAQGKSGRLLFEVGEVFAYSKIWFGDRETAAVGAACKQAEQLYRQWCAEAEAAVMCWLWCTRELKVVKDVRLMISDRIWEGRAAWSERRIVGVAGSRP